MLKFKQITNERTLKEFSLIIFSLAIILLILFVLDRIENNYQGISFIPGLRLYSKHLFADTNFFAPETIEFQLGNLAIELIIGFIFLLQIYSSFNRLVFKKLDPDAPKWWTIFISLSLIFLINFILVRAI